MNYKEDLKEKMKLPEGTCSFKFKPEKNIYDKKLPGGIIFENISGKHYFMIERSNDLKINFYHFSPGTGTRLAVVDISKSAPSSEVQFIFTWSPDKLKLYAGPIGVEKKSLESSIEVKPEINFAITDGGQVIRIGGPGVEVTGVRIKNEGKVILKDTAINSWNETLKAIDIMSRSTSEDGYMFEVVRANFITVMLVSGIESYCKNRLQEIESEGVELNYEKLEKKTKLTKDKIFKETSNYFQSLEYMKKIWRYLADIDCYNLNTEIWQSFCEELFPHRHSIVHAHPLKTEIENPNKNELFVTNEILRLKDNCVIFIEKLHEKTLELR